MADGENKTVSGERSLPIGKAKSLYKHGLSRHPTYMRWNAMKKRCFGKNTKAYRDYGGRGITVCDRWLDFEPFLEDMGFCPPGLTLDRINNDGNYEPGNCRWATRMEQQQNRRAVLNVTFNGETRCLEEWARKLGVTGPTIRRRIRAGWPLEKALKGKPYKRAES